MKCEITAGGMLIVKSETDLESYALKQWVHTSKVEVSGPIQFNWGYDSSKPSAECEERKGVNHEN